MQSKLLKTRIVSTMKFKRAKRIRLVADASKHAIKYIRF